MKISMYLIFSTEDIETCDSIINKLKSFYSPLSIAPLHECKSMAHALDTYVSFEIDNDQFQILLSQLSSAFDEYEDEWECYSITSRTFDKDVYYIHIDAY